MEATLNVTPPAGTNIEVFFKVLDPDHFDNIPGDQYDPNDGLDDFAPFAPDDNVAPGGAITTPGATLLTFTGTIPSTGDPACSCGAPANSVVLQGDGQKNTVVMCMKIDQIQPANNFIVVADTKENLLDQLAIDGTDGVTVRVADPVDGPALAQAKQTKILTVWRKLHVEVDSMGIAAPPLIAGNITGVVAGAVEATVLTNTPISMDSVNRFEGGKFFCCNNVYDVLESNANATEIKVNRQGKAVPTVGAEYILKDDDFEYDDIPDPPTGLMAPLFEDACVLPVFDGGGNVANNNSQVPFFENFLTADEWEVLIWGAGAQITQAQCKPNRAREFWAVYVLGGFQETLNGDNDPDLEGEFLGATYPSMGAVRDWGSGIWMETIRDSSVEYAFDEAIVRSETVVHEVGHQFQCEHSDGGIMATQNVPAANPVFTGMSKYKIMVVDYP